MFVTVVSFASFYSRVDLGANLGVNRVMASQMSTQCAIMVGVEGQNVQNLDF